MSQLGGKRSGPPAAATPRKVSGRVLQFLKSVPGIVTVVVGLVGGIATIISQSQSILKVIRPPKTISQLVPKPEVKYLKVLPYRWKSLMARSDLPYLDWYYIQVVNKSNLRLNLNVTFKVTTREGEEIPCKFTPEYSVDPDGTLTEYPPLVLDFGQHQVSLGDTLDIAWHIRDERGTDLWQDTNHTELLPDNMIDWDARTLDGDSFPTNFLLASLTAWTMPPRESLAKTVEELQQGIGTAALPASVDRWFATAYRRFFNDPSGLVIIPADAAFPGKGRQTIRTFSEVLNDHEANSVEAALFLGALSRATYGKKIRLVLFAVPESQDRSTAKTLFFSWSTDSNSWHAVSLAEANSSSFESNEQLASRRVAELLANHPEIKRALNDEGVFVEKGQQVVALDFVRADQKYQFSAVKGK